MGLDNIPNTYPCIKAGTAVIVKAKEDPDQDVLDCDETIEREQCPWVREAVGRGTAVTSAMMGTPCWYRGKAAHWMIDELQEAGHRFTELNDPIGNGFYGEDNQLSPDYCNRLAKWMEDRVEPFAALHKGDEDGGKAVIERFRYAAWWLRFVAEHADGARAWW